MYAVKNPQILWNRKTLDAANIPSEAKEFLATVGLPEFFNGFTVEFGIYDSQLDGLVIGDDTGNAVVVRADGRVWIDKENEDDLFINSSVQAMSKFLHLINQLDEGAFADDDELTRRLRALPSELALLDPEAFNNAAPKLWPPLVEYMVALG